MLITYLFMTKNLVARNQRDVTSLSSVITYYIKITIV